MTQPPFNLVASGKQVFVLTGKKINQTSFEKISILNLYLFNSFFHTGLNGEETVIDVGDITSLLPIPDRNQFYDVKDLTEITGSDPLSVIGPCGGPWQFIGADSEASTRIYLNSNSYI